MDITVNKGLLSLAASAILEILCDLKVQSFSIFDKLLSSEMADREDNVYMAKLAEQAERYDGIYSYKIVFVQHPWKMSGLVHVTSSHNFNEEAVNVCKYDSAISPCNISVIDASLICHSVEL